MNAKVREIMKTDVYTVTDEANIGEVIRILVDNQINGVPIVDGKEKVVGFISDGDIMKFVAKQNPRIIDMTSFITVWYDTESFEKKMDDLMDLNVMELATTKLVSVEADYDIDEALAMRKDIQKMEVDVLAAMTGI